MVTSVGNVTFEYDVVMPDVDLSNVRLLVDRLIEYQGVGEMSFDDIANLSALLPAASRSLGIESQLTYEASAENFRLAHEAFSNGVKASIVAVLAAAIAIVIKFFRMRKDKGFSNGGPDKTEFATISAAEAYRREFMKTAPVLDKQIEEFRAHMDYFSKDVGLSVLDGDVRPGLIPVMVSMINLTRRFTTNPIPSFDRNRDKARIGDILRTCAEALKPGHITAKSFLPQNFLFRSDKENFADTMFFDELFRYLRQNKIIEVVIPNLSQALGRMRFQPRRVPDIEMGGAREVIDETMEIISNSFSPFDMAKAVRVDDYNKQDPVDAWVKITDTLRKHADSIFGTELYAEVKDRPGQSEVYEKRVQDYYDFLTKDIDNDRGQIWTRVVSLVDECGDLLALSEKAVNGRNDNFLAIAREYANYVQQKYDRDMFNADKDSIKFTDEQIANYYDLKRIGVFVSTTVRFLAELSRMVNSLTSFELRLGEVKGDMDSLTKTLLVLNEELRKIKA